MGRAASKPEHEHIILHEHAPSCTSQVGDAYTQDNRGKKQKINTRPLPRWAMCWGYLLMVFETCIAATSVGSSQALGGLVPTFQLNLLRFGIIWLCVAVVIVCKRLYVRPQSSHLVYLGMYCLTYVIGNALTYESSIYLPVGIICGLHVCIVLILTTVITTVVQRRIQSEAVSSALLCVTDIVLMIQPQFIFKYFLNVRTIYTHPVCPRHFEYNDTINISLAHDLDVGANDYDVIQDETKGYIIMLVATVSFLISLHVLKYKLEEVNGFVILFWMSIVGVLLSGVPMIVLETPVLPKSPTCVTLLFAHSLSTAFDTLSIVYALSVLSTQAFSILSSLLIIFIMIAQYTVLSNVNPGHRNLIEIIGAIVVFVGCVWEPISVNWKLGRQNM